MKELSGSVTGRCEDVLRSTSCGYEVSRGTLLECVRVSQREPLVGVRVFLGALPVGVRVSGALPSGGKDFGGMLPLEMFLL